MQLFQGRRSHDRFHIDDAGEAHHCIKVTRHRKGDSILVTEFSGAIWTAVIQDIMPDQVTAMITGLYTEQRQRASVALAVSLTQNTDRFEWFVEKATETGMDRIIPLLCARSEQKKDRSDRWRKIILSSAKQCLRPSLPVLDSLQSFAGFITTTSPAQRYICHCENAELPFLGSLYDAHSDALVMIGPEGDFTSQEIGAARAAGFREAGLGPDRLRVETAAMAAGMICKTIQCMP